MIPADDYKQIIANIPILCVDLVLTDESGRFLLAKRTNQPLKGDFWVIGGRVQKGERAEDAARRKLKEELGVEVGALALLGVYEDFFDENSMGLDTLYHTVSIVFSATLSRGAEIQLDRQHDEWKWSAELPERFVISSPERGTADSEDVSAGSVFRATGRDGVN